MWGFTDLMEEGAVSDRDSESLKAHAQSHVVRRVIGRTGAHVAVYQLVDCKPAEHHPGIEHKTHWLIQGTCLLYTQVHFFSLDCMK